MECSKTLLVAQLTVALASCGSGSDVANDAAEKAPEDHSIGQLSSDCKTQWRSLAIRECTAKFNAAFGASSSRDDALASLAADLGTRCPSSEAGGLGTRAARRLISDFRDGRQQGMQFVGRMCGSLIDDLIDDAWSPPSPRPVSDQTSAQSAPEDIEDIEPPKTLEELRAADAPPKPAPTGPFERSDPAAGRLRQSDWEITSARNWLDQANIVRVAGSGESQGALTSGIIFVRLMEKMPPSRVNGATEVIDTWRIDCAQHRRMHLSISAKRPDGEEVLYERIPEARRVWTPLPPPIWDTFCQINYLVRSPE